MVLGRDVPGHATPTGSRIQMTEQQFIDWLKHVDTNRDGRISRKELRDALRVLGLHLTRWKAWRGVANADLNHNHVIDGELEVKKLIDYAAKRWGIVIVSKK